MFEIIFVHKSMGKLDTVQLIKDKLADMAKKKPVGQIIILSKEEFEPFIDELLLPPTNILIAPFARYDEFIFYKVCDILENPKLCTILFHAKVNEVKVFLSDKYSDINLNEAILVKSTW